MDARPVSPALTIRAETPADAEAIDALVLAAFGPGRFAKTAERLREGATPSAGYVACENGRLVGSVRIWPIRVGEDEALFLGPIAVAAERRRGGLGADLVGCCLQAAREAEVAGVLLVGDPPYFSRFGFAAASQLEMPGPVDPRRLLWAPLRVGAPSGAVSAGG